MKSDFSEHSRFRNQRRGHSVFMIGVRLAGIDLSEEDNDLLLAIAVHCSSKMTARDFCLTDRSSTLCLKCSTNDPASCAAMYSF